MRTCPKRQENRGETLVISLFVLSFHSRLSMSKKTVVRLCFFRLFLPLLFLCGTAASRVGENKTSAGKVYVLAPGDENGAVPSKNLPGDETTTQSDSIFDEDVEGAFSSLDGMLQWAIGNSDPEKLKEKANDAQRMSAEELNARRLEVKELMEKLKMPSDADLMRISIEDLKNSSTSEEDRQRALNELLTLVEPIDNANDLNKLGGLVAVIQELNYSSPQIRSTAAWILGKASQNNPLVQHQVLSLGALTALMNMVHSSCIEESSKALFAISAVIRNNVDGLTLFYSHSGFSMLQAIMRNSSIDLRLRKKAVQMVNDIADWLLEENVAPLDFPLLWSPIFFESVVSLLSSSDIDLQEKALMAIGSLLRLPYSESLVLNDPCGLDNALETMREKMTDTDEEFATDVEILRRQVRSLFREKKEIMNSASDPQLMKVPT